MPKHTLDERFGKEYAGEYVFEPISWGKMMQITQRYTKHVGRKAVVNNHAVTAKLIDVMLVKRPKAITFARLMSDESPDKGGLPIGLGQWLTEIVNELTGPTFETQKKLTRAMMQDLPHPELARYRLCKEFGWSPQWLDGQVVEIRIFGKKVASFRTRGISAKTVNTLVFVQSLIDAETKEKLQEIDKNLPKGATFPW